MNNLLKQLFRSHLPKTCPTWSRTSIATSNFHTDIDTRSTLRDSISIRNQFPFFFLTIFHNSRLDQTLFVCISFYCDHEQLSSDTFVEKWRANFFFCSVLESIQRSFVCFAREYPWNERVVERPWECFVVLRTRRTAVFVRNRYALAIQLPCQARATQYLRTYNYSNSR